MPKYALLQIQCAVVREPFCPRAFVVRHGALFSDGSVSVKSPRQAGQRLSLDLGEAFGARPQTLTGLSGLGDLILTCSSTQSRNYSFGIALGRGSSPTEAGGKLAEGVFTAPVLVELAQAKGIEMPIARAVVAILSGRAGVDEAIETLLTRPFRAEG